MEDLQRIYREALRERIAALEAARSAGGEEGRQTIRRIAHALRGSGGTYGFPEVSEAAHAVEQASTDDFSAHLDHFIAVLRSIAGLPGASSS